MGAIAAELPLFCSTSFIATSSSTHCRGGNGRRSRREIPCNGLGSISSSSSSSSSSSTGVSSSSRSCCLGPTEAAFGSRRSWAETDSLVLAEAQCSHELSQDTKRLRGLDRRRRRGGAEQQRPQQLRGTGTRRATLTPVQMMWGKVEAPKPSYIPLELISGEDHFNQVLSEAAERDEAIIVDWLATWCRKCIYLKPKLEKLAAEYHPKLKFYGIDVNTVPQTLVKRANVTL